MADFDTIAASADAAIDGVLGEEIRIEPRLAPGYTGAGTADPDRAIRTVVGTVRMAAEADTLGGQSPRLPIGLTVVAGRKTILHLSRAAAEAICYELVAGDKVVRTKRDSDNLFEVVDAWPGDLGDLFVHLVTA